MYTRMMETLLNMKQANFPILVYTTYGIRISKWEFGGNMCETAWVCSFKFFQLRLDMLYALILPSS